MKALAGKLAQRYDALQLRERWLVAAAILGAIVLVGHGLFVAPAQTRARLAERSLSEQQVQLSALNAQMLAMQSPNQDPNVAARAELDSLKKQLAEQAARIALMESALVPPHQMAGLLEEMIGRRSGLRLLSLKTLPVAAALEKKAVAGAAESGKPGVVPTKATDGLFKHGVEITLEGSYQELAAYLERLEQAKPKLLWSGVSLSADKHPRLVLTLTAYSLSLERAWLIL
jgi:MSHA biogenesis protein MshJ